MEIDYISAKSSGFLWIKGAKDYLQRDCHIRQILKAGMGIDIKHFILPDKLDF